MYVAAGGPTQQRAALGMGSRQARLESSMSGRKVNHFNRAPSSFGRRGGGVSLANTLVAVGFGDAWSVAFGGGLAVAFDCSDDALISCEIRGTLVRFGTVRVSFDQHRALFIASTTLFGGSSEKVGRVHNCASSMEK